MRLPTAVVVGWSVASAPVGGVFLGNAPLLGIAAYLGWQAPRSTPWPLASFLICLVGSVGATMAFDVPRNA